VSTAVTVRHKLQSTRTDLTPNPDPSRVSKNAWNDDHALGAAPGNNLLLFSDSTSPTGLSWASQVSVSDALSTLTLGSQNFGNDAAGPSLIVGRNTSGGAVGPSAGTLALTDTTGNLRYCWVDATAILRLHTAAPTGSTGSPTVSDTAGKAVLAVPVATFTVGDLFSPDTTTTLARIAAVASGSVLTSAGTGTLPAWSSAPTISGAANFSGTGANAVQVSGKMFVSLLFQITNNAGTLQHRIIDAPATLGLPAYSGRPTDASTSYANTPTNMDSTHGFTNGAGILAADATSLLWNTGNLPIGHVNFITSIELNSTGTAFVIGAYSSGSTNVNGTIQRWPVFQLVNATSGAVSSWNTTTIASGKTIAWRFFGYLP
jgi:hypothetical protein